MAKEQVAQRERESIARLLAGHQFVECAEGTSGGVGDLERAILRHAAATTKAVSIALQGAEYVTANEETNAAFTAEDAAAVLLSLSALLTEAPSLLRFARGES